MNLWFISDDRYAKYLVVVVKSIIVNNKRKKRIFVSTTGISESNQQLLHEVCDELTTIEFIYTGNELFEGLDFCQDSIQSGRWIKTIFCKLIPNIILPPEVDRVLFLGVDMIIRQDICALYDLDLGDNILAGCPAAKTYKQIFNNTFDSNKIINVNGETILFDVKKFRELGITLEGYAQFDGPNITEEKLLSRRFNGKIKYLDTFIWNYRFNEIHAGLLKYKLLEPKSIIFHYASHRKPWFYFASDDQEFIKVSQLLGISYEFNNAVLEWWDYAKMCPNYDSLYSNAKMIRQTLIIQSNTYYKRNQYQEELLNNYSALLMNNTQFNKLINYLRSFKSIKIIENEDLLYTNLFRCYDINVSTMEHNIPSLVINCTEKDYSDSTKLINLLEEYNLSWMYLNDKL